ncbi:hypothetical protein FRX31_032402, partial [Thalictrum thalictroides]
ENNNDPFENTNGYLNDDYNPTTTNIPNNNILNEEPITIPDNIQRQDMEVEATII